MNLKWKILTGVTLTSTLAVIVSSIIFVAMELRRLDENINTQALTTARLIGANTTGALAFDDAGSATQTLSSLGLNKSIVGAVLFDDSGNQFARFSAPGQSPSSLPNRPGAFEIARSPDDSYIELYDPVRMDGDQIGSIYLRVSLDEQSAVVSDFMVSAVIIILGVAAMALAISFLVQRSIVGPINEVVAAMRDIAEGDGDLTQRIRVQTTDEVGQLANWFNVFVERVHGVVSKFSESAFNLSDAAEYLSSTTVRTATGAGRQQYEITQVAAAMAEMAQTVEEVARNVGLAASDAENADSEANRGAGVVAQTMKSIEELARDIDKAADVITQLQKQTDSIGSVLDVIRGIAEQTNLLALNAAIEAARAGEQGRGFAVVADEVRTLASRTQASTEEIQEMIQKLQSGAKQAVQVMSKGKDQASSSVDHAGRAGESLQAITKAVSVIRDMSNQIASASEEQSAVTIEIKQNINNISEVANDTAVSSKEITSGADELTRLASDMKKLVSQFKV